MINDSLKITTTTRYKFPHGAVYLGPTTETLSSGFLELAPGQATPKMQRPLPEHVKQITGSCEIEMFDDQNRISIRRLHPGDAFIIPTNALRVHRNRFEQPSLNYWEYQGNVISLMDKTKAEGIVDDFFPLPADTSAEALAKVEASSEAGPAALPIQPEQCEVYRLPTAKIYIGKSDATASYGFLELKPGMAMDRHNRPVLEQLTQIKGTSEIELFDANGAITITKLTPGMQFTIPANQFHVHANKSPQDSLTFWHFSGDVTSIVNDIRSQGIKIT